MEGLSVTALAYAKQKDSRSGLLAACGLAHGKTQEAGTAACSWLTQVYDTFTTKQMHGYAVIIMTMQLLKHHGFCFLLLLTCNKCHAELKLLASADLQSVPRRFKEQPFPKDLSLMPTFPVKQGEGRHHHKAKHTQPSPRKAAKVVPSDGSLFQPNSRSR